MRAAKGEGSLFGTTARGFRGYVTVGGKRKYFSGRTKAEAAQKKRDLLARRDAGTLTPGKVATVEQWMKHWLDTIAQIRPTTRQTHEWVYRNRVVGSPIAGVRLDALTVEHLEQWIASLDVKPASAKRYLAPLAASLTAAVKRGHMGANPVDRLDLAPAGKPDTRSLSRADRDAILAAATGRNRARWHVALKLGFRPAEALGLTWPDFDPSLRRLQVRRQLLRAHGAGLYLQDATKTRAGDRFITLPRSLVAMLHEHRREQLAEMADAGWVGWEFNGAPVPLMFAQADGRPIDARMDAALWRALLTAAGLPKERRYIARHTAATHALDDSSGDVAVVAEMLGHADSGFTYRTYVHPLETRKEQLADAMDAPYGAPYDGNVSEHGRTRADSETND